ALWWLIEITDTYLLSDRLQRNGIVPRRSDGIDGILWAPFLHSDFGHVMSNTFPFLILSGLILLRGLRRWMTVTIIGILLGGLLTWLIGGTGNHIGGSGVIFAYFGALFGAAFFERRPAALAPALVAVVMYTTTVVVGLVPQDSVSWEGHLSGFIAGIVAAKLLAEPRPARPDPDADIEAIFGNDEPWKLT
ncbi:MAG: rhomboid family intramembrane serine protease, partial [Acidimicrobiales bacterium]|nr:rhomboid family intramembrane serine protease [Acidimicrobiales bacterium]